MSQQQGQQHGGECKCDKCELGCTCPFTPIGKCPPMFFACPEMRKGFMRALAKSEACAFAKKRCMLYGPGLGFGVWHPCLAECCCKDGECKDVAEKCCKECCKEGDCHEAEQKIMEKISKCDDIPEWIGKCPECAKAFVCRLVKIHAMNMCRLIHGEPCVCCSFPSPCGSRPCGMGGPCCSKPCAPCCCKSGCGCKGGECCKSGSCREGQCCSKRE